LSYFKFQIDENGGFIMMKLKDLEILLSKKKRKKERIKVAGKFALLVGVLTTIGATVGILFAPKSGKETREKIKENTIDTVETIKDTVQKSAEATKNSIHYVAEEVHQVINGVQEKAEDINKDLKDGGHEIAQDIHKTAEKISKEIKQPL
jgi:gas vesicle protein